MFLPDDPSASGGEYVEGTPGVQVPTRVRADHLNAFTYEIANAITLMGVDLSKPDNDQLGKVLKAQRLRHVKSALNAFRLAEDTGSGTTLTGIARRASDRIVSLVGTSGSVQVLDPAAMTFGAGSVTNSYSGNFSSICYDSGFDRFFAAGATGEIQSSSNGSAYTRRANGGANFNSIAGRNGSSGGNSVVAVGNSELIKYTLNGTSFSTSTSPFAGTPNITSVISPVIPGNFHMGYWCATENGDVAHSNDDGVNWTVQLATAGSSTSGQLAYHPSLGLFYRYGGLLYFSDGFGTWTQIHNALGTGAALLVLEDCWLVQTVPGMIQGRTVLTANAPAEFTIEFLGHSGLPVALDDQLWAFQGENVYVGGSL